MQAMQKPHNFRSQVYGFIPYIYTCSHQFATLSNALVKLNNKYSIFPQFFSRKDLY